MSESSESSQPARASLLMMEALVLVSRRVQKEEEGKGKVFGRSCCLFGEEEGRRQSVVSQRGTYRTSSIIVVVNSWSERMNE